PLWNWWKRLRRNRVFELGWRKRGSGMIARFVLMVGFVVSVAIAGVAQDEAKVAAQTELNAGVQAFRQAHYEEAIDYFNRAVTVDPEFTVARMYLATTYLQMFEPGVDTPENVIWAT